MLFLINNNFLRNKEMNFNIVHKIKSKLQLLPTFILMLLMLSLFSTECNAKPRYQVGNIIEFGSYYQDDLSSKTPIKWRVLDIQDGKALLISELLLDAKRYNIIDKGITWENSSIRNWLNNEFINQAFSKEEQNEIILTNISNPNNARRGTNGGNNTQDKIFLLSIDEAEKYFKDDKDRECKTTNYAKQQGAWTTNDNKYLGNCNWWLRSPGEYQDAAAHVYSDGKVIDFGYRVDGFDVFNLHIAVRPALYINL